MRSTTRGHQTPLRRPKSGAAPRGPAATDESAGSKISRTGVGGGEEGVEKLESKSKENKVVLDATGEVREKQRVEVEFGTFHEFTAVNKTKGYDYCLLRQSCECVARSGYARMSTLFSCT